jgi:2-amino-4-hydroxy-6-hydroxymethyldihydropteridine diphosphokinase
VIQNVVVGNNKAYIAFGANLPYANHSPADTIMKACDAMKGRGVILIGLSRLWQSPAWPDPSAPAYVNAVAEISTALPPFALLHVLRSIEQKFGRQRSARNAPRTLDIDILSYGKARIQTQHLQIPHPRLAVRTFVLLPLFDIAPHWRYPGTGQPLSALIRALPKESKAQTLPL